ncbi:MAG: DUF721 domain-containing protein [Chlamydiota bacterium]|nr:DUF721 domain-containing protein [Chlamydiota bacterium]
MMEMLFVETEMKRRTPKGYHGARLSYRRIGESLPSLLAQLNKRRKEDPNQVMREWRDLAPTHIAHATAPTKYEGDQLWIAVNHPLLYSRLLEQEGKPLLLRLQERFPHVKGLRFFIDPTAVADKRKY